MSILLYRKSTVYSKSYTMKRIVFFTGVLLFLWTSSGAQKASSHNDINSNNAVNTTFRPQLAYPEDKSTIVIPNPVLIWLPPPTSGNTLIVYSIRLVKMENGQTPQEALLQNPPLVNLNGLTNNFLSYPTDAPTLENSTQYAWQVAASSAGKSLGVADVNTFSVVQKNDEKSKPELAPLPTSSKQKSDSNNTKQNKKTTNQTANIAQKPNNNSAPNFDVYPVASVVSDGHFYLTSGVIKFAYINKANDKNLTYVIKRLDKNENLSSLPELNISPGTNKLAINLQHNEEMEQGKYYDLEITDSKGKAYKLLYYYVTQ